MDNSGCQIDDFVFQNKIPQFFEFKDLLTSKKYEKNDNNDFIQFFEGGTKVKIPSGIQPYLLLSVKFIYHQKATQLERNSTSF